MVLEWEAAIKANTLLTPLLHYGSSYFDYQAWGSMKAPDKFPWRHVIITTKHTFMTRWNGAGRFWNTYRRPRFHRVVLDEGHRFRSSGHRLGTHYDLSTERDSKVHGDSNIIWAETLEKLRPEAKWMLTATPLVNSLVDLRWVCRFLERPEWLEQNLPPDTFVNQHDLHGIWFADPNRVSPAGNAPNMVLTPTSDLFRCYAKYGSMAHCTTLAWDCCIGSDMDSVGLRRWQAESLSGVEREDKLQSAAAAVERCGNNSRAILKTLMLRRSMTSRIPFKTGAPIIDIPVMKTVTTRLRFAADGSKDIYVMLVNNYASLREKFGTKAPGSAAVHRFSPRWRFIRLVSLSPLLAYASFSKDFSYESLYPRDEVVGFDRKKLEWLVSGFLKISKTQSPLFKEAGMSNEDFLHAMEFGSPKLGRVGDQLRSLVREKKKVILWVYWPLSQWLLQQV